MPFQRTVKRNFPVGFPGEIVRDGPTRAIAARIATSSKPTNPRNQGNRVGRAFGYVGEVPLSGTTQAALVPTVEIGGVANAYAGILIHPKHYVLQGTQAGGSLAPSMDLPDASEGEFANMVTGLVVEIFNHTTGSVTIKPGDQLGYVPVSITDVQDTLILPYGAIIAVPAGSSVPAGFMPINGRVMNSITLAASAVGTLVAGLTIIQTNS